MFKSAAAFGCVLGVGFGIWNMVQSATNPLSDDSIPALLIFYGPMFGLWALTGFIAARRSGRISQGFKAGAVVACATFVVYVLANQLRVNVFLDSLRGRADWQQIVSSFPASGFRSFRAYVNYFYLSGTPFKIAVATVIGTLFGGAGGLVGAVSRRA